MKNRNVIFLFTKRFEIDREDPKAPYFALTWEDVELLFTAIISDTIYALSEIPGLDIILVTENIQNDNELINDLKNKAIILEYHNTYFTNRVIKAFKHISKSDYENILLMFSYYPIVDRNLLLNILELLSDDEEYMFISLMKNFQIGFLGIKNNYSSLFEDCPSLEFGEILKTLPNESVTLYTLGNINSIIDGYDIANLKNKIKNLVNQDKVYFPVKTSEVLKYFDKKSKRNETRDIRRYF